MKVLVADDHALIRDGLERSLLSHDLATQVIHAFDRASVISQLNANPDIEIILLDLFMPEANDFELLENICDEYNNIPVIVISGEEEPRYMRKSIDTGASGFIPKSASTEIMLSAINLVLSGGVYIPSDILKQKISNHSKKLNDEVVDVSLLTNETRDAVKKLTKRQSEVLGLISQGLSNKEIAKVFGLSEHTVKIHVTAVLKLLNAENRTEAAVMAHKASVVEK